jgi:hypothetical protein
VNPALAVALLAVAGLLATRLPGVPIPGSLTLPRRMLAAGGLPLALVGLVLGPGINLLDQTVVTSVAPVVAFAVGWVAADFGARWEWRMARRIGWRRAALLVAGAVATFLLVALLAWAAARLVAGLGIAWAPVGTTVTALAAVAAVSGPDALQHLARTVGAPPRVATALRRAGLLEAGAATLVIALTLAVGHSRHTIVGVILGTLRWLALACAAGALAAVVFVALTRSMQVGVPLALVAAVLAGAGLGWAAGLSPFVVCALAGAFIVNLPGERRGVQAALAAWEPTLVGLLAFVAGAILAVPTPWLLAVVVLFAGARVAAKWAGTRGAIAVEPRGALPANLGLGLVAQGGIVMAMGVSFFLLQGETAAGRGFVTATVLGVAIAQATAAPLLGLALAPPQLTPGPRVSDLRAGSPVT